MKKNRNWDILLIGGASGAGKSCISYALSEIYGLGITEVDDFQCVLEDMTREDDYPLLHYWKNHFEEALAQPFEKKLEIMCGYAKIMRLSRQSQALRYCRDCIYPVRKLLMLFNDRDASRPGGIHLELFSK